MTGQSPAGTGPLEERDPRRFVLRRPGPALITHHRRGAEQVQRAPPDRAGRTPFHPAQPDGMHLVPDIAVRQIIQYGHPQLVLEL